MIPLSGCCMAAGLWQPGMGIVTAVLVTICSRWPRFWRILKVCGGVVPIMLYLLMLLFHILGRDPFPVSYWLLASWVSIIPAQFARRRSGNAQVDGTTESPGKGLSPGMRALIVLLV